MTRFVLLGHMRSGSTLIMHALSQHPNVHMFGELFNRSRKVRELDYTLGLTKCAAAARPGIDEESYFHEGDNAAEFLTKRVFFERTSEPIAVGFKLFYDHAHHPERGMGTWEYLAADKDIRIVHLIRRNLVRVLVSFRLATKTRVWNLPKGEAGVERPPTTLSMDAAEFEEFFNEHHEQRKRAEQLFKNHRTLTIEYEDDVCAHFQKTIYRIQDFLEVPRRRALKLIERQGRGRLCDRLTNHRELKTHFAGTIYESMFD